MLHDLVHKLHVKLSLIDVLPNAIRANKNIEVLSCISENPRYMFAKIHLPKFRNSIGLSVELRVVYSN